jgi:competence protein ComEC
MQVTIPIWKEAPFIRLVVPLAAGILIQWQTNLPGWISYLTLITSAAITIIFGYFQTYTRYRFYQVSGIFINILLLSLGITLVFRQAHGSNGALVADRTFQNKVYFATVDAPLSEKKNSFKTVAVLDYISVNDSLVPVKEKIIIYFQKDSSLRRVSPHSRITFRKPLKPVSNTGNPGAFDYREFCKLQGISFEIYLRAADYVVSPAQYKTNFKSFLINSREKIVRILERYIRGDKEAGMAAALLIGYKDNLDKDLVQSYTNTGVVHIIAISGLHVGLIYWLTSQVFYPLGKTRKTRLVKAVLTICSLWLFSLVAGGSPSVLRSAMMFSFIVAGESTGKKSGVYNSLAASGFLLLCYNPLWLFDVGFQLSYVAVLSILIFMKPLYHCLIVENRLLDLTWKMCSLSIAAQILTTPLSIFLFGQFPNYFLITNLVAVPLSTMVLFCELCVCGFAGFPPASTLFGWITTWLIKLMNGFVGHMNQLPFATWQMLQLSLLQVILVYILISALAHWLFSKSVHAFIVALLCLAATICWRSFNLIKSSGQCKMIVYNIPRHNAIDLVQGNSCVYVGDGELKKDVQQYNFFLRPTRQLYRVNEVASLPKLALLGQGFYFANKKVLVIDSAPAQTGRVTCTADVVILSGNPDLEITTLLNTISFGELVFDSSNSQWRIDKWKEECRKFHLRYYSVPEKGAFILNVN